MPNSELLAPAGDREALEAALRFGADAVYVGGPRLQLHAAKAGFTMDALADAARLVHEKGKKLYVTVNAFCGEGDIDALPGYAGALRDLGADAVIVSDLGAVRTIHRAVPDLDIHISTQANCLNHAAAQAWRDMGAKRVVLGREMTLAEIRALHARVPDIELESFVHGAMCMAWSGRCMLSAYLTGRSANKGACTQPCRWTYHLMEEKRPGQFFPVEEDDRGMAILSSHDLNALTFLDDIAQVGVTSFKIEGRMKTPYYVATVVNAYRLRLDGRGDIEALERELDAVSHRPYSTGFYFGELKTRAAAGGAYLSDCLYVANVCEDSHDGWTRILLRNRFDAGDTVEVVSPGTVGTRRRILAIVDEEGNAVGAATVPDRPYSIRTELPLRKGDYLRIRIDNTKGA